MHSGMKKYVNPLELTDFLQLFGNKIQNKIMDMGSPLYPFLTLIGVYISKSYSSDVWLKNTEKNSSQLKKLPNFYSLFKNT